MYDRRYTNMWGETLDEQEKRRQWLREVYDKAVTKTPNQQTFLNQNDNNFAQTKIPANNLPQTSNPSTMDKLCYAANAGLQGLSMGWSDEIEGAMSGLGYGLASLNSNWNKTGESFGDAFKRGYQQTRDFRRNQMQEGREKAPILTATAEAVGNIVSPLNKIGAVSSRAPLATKLANSRNIAIRNGAINGVGSAEENWQEHLYGSLKGMAGSAVGNIAANEFKPATNYLFMNQAPRELISNTVEKTVSTLSDEGLDELRRRLGF
ncbi:MAG: hypothetical protein IKA03_06395 [Alphaproteobacteria bacterium]|nr:hypothetical protein [Alphaproteobacteria bacterium]